ncbi:unnamed protein product [Spirodela intermedia]|uniref:Uncharacterized protein n=1 Tax=Spirodela intermedia TaxID=51605 RepID=A0A7I8JFR5_SPIIN|nr:unnamed protein product [Spirodela intermedia]CAA6668996.1 unnamed protein product [Spirodela intermedia]
MVQVRDTIWGVLNETEDHIVPYPKESECDSPSALTEYSKKQRHEQTNANLIISDQGKSDSKNDFPGSSGLEGNSDFDTHEELSASRFDMDSWPDLPSLNTAFSKGFIERNHLHPMSSKFISDCTGSTPMVTAPENIVTDKDASLKDPCSLPVGSDRDMFINGHEHKESDSFLDCDWGNIADFDDFDRIFRNDDSLFGHEMISHADEILSPSADGDNSVTPSFAISGIMSPREQAMGQSQLIMDNCVSLSTDKAEEVIQVSEEDGGEDQNGLPQKLSGTQQFEGVKMAGSFKSPSQSIFHGEDGGSGYTGIFPAAGKFFRPSFEYPIHAFPTVPVLSAGPPARKQSQPAGESPRAYQASSKLAMTPQEKIEKLRRRQQMQAMLAIQQQQQQLEQKSTSTEMSATQISSQQNQSLAAADEAAKLISSSELSLPTEGEELQNSVLIDDSLGETIFYQLRDAIGSKKVCLLCDDGLTTYYSKDPSPTHTHTHSLSLSLSLSLIIWLGGSQLNNIFSVFCVLTAAARVFLPSSARQRAAAAASSW